MLLSIELGHITLKNFPVSTIDQHFTISHNQRTLQHNLAGFAIYTSKHFYSIQNNNEQSIFIKDKICMYVCMYVCPHISSEITVPNSTKFCMPPRS